jgi:hypothetical protein
MTTIARPLGSLRPLAAVAAVAALLATAVLVLAGAAPRAGAHEGDAVIEVEHAEPSGLTVHYDVLVTWADDGHPAVDATVTATALGADGTQVTPVTLAPTGTEGHYAGAVEFPSAGSWTVRVTSIKPTGTIEVDREVTAPAAEDQATTAPPETAAPAEDATGAAGEDDGAAVPGDDEAADDSDSGGSDGMPVALIVIAAVVVIGGAIAAVRTIAKTRAAGPATGGAAVSPDGESSDAASDAEEVQS